MEGTLFPVKNTCKLPLHNLCPQTAHTNTISLRIRFVCFWYFIGCHPKYTYTQATLPLLPSNTASVFPQMDFGGTHE